MSRAVSIKVRAEGVNFACRGFVLDAQSGEQLAEGLTRPHNMRHVAYRDAELIAEERGWQVQEYES